MIQNTDNRPLSQLYSSDHKVTYFIPKYQREYIWGKNNWEALFDDILDSSGGHFLGSIICINQQLDTYKDANLELVDGQQRMTTISLLYLSIYKFLKDNFQETGDVDFDDEEKYKLRSLKKRIIVDRSLRLSPSHSNSNYEDYKYIFSTEIKDINSPRKPKFLGLRQMHRAFNYFNNRFNELDSDNNPLFKFKSVESFLQKLNTATLVQIDVLSHADAFILFETLNNRGVPLSAIDLIKNKLLGELDKNSKNTSLNENFDRWNNILINLTDNYKVQERFLRQFYNAFRLEDEIKVDKKPKALRSNLIHIFETLIKRDVSRIFDRLERASEIYSRNIQYENKEYSNSLIKALRNLENVNGADAYMLLLFLENKFELTDTQKVELIDLLCKYFIRRNITDSPPTRDLTNYFMDIIEEINNHENYEYSAVKEAIIKYGRPASDDYFELKLNGDLYEENVGATRYVLSSLELAQNNDREGYKNFYERSKNKFIWTIEHVLPQGRNMKPHWVEMVADGDTTVANQIREEFVHKLGNLTLTGYNSQLSDMSLDAKQDKKDKDGNFIGFKNGLMLNEALKGTKVWTKEHIESRTASLVKKALEIFEL